MSKAYDELLVLIGRQQEDKKNTDVFMVGEQLKDIGAESEHNAEILLQDLEVKGMGLADAAARLKKYADDHKGSAKCFCISPKVADGILREFYGLAAKEEVKGSGVQDNSFIDLGDFL